MPLYARYPRNQIATGRHDVPPSDPAAEQFLRDARIGDGWLHPDASNYTFIVELQLGDCRAHGVYKPRSGEAPLWDFPAGTLYRRECAAYALSKALGWGLIPPTVEREGEAGEGSLQLFVPHDPDSNFFTFRDEREEESLRLAVFDVVANNADRKGGHCFVGPDEQVWAVDNGLTFNIAYKLRTVIWDFSGSRVPCALLDDASRVADDIASGEGPLALALSRLLDQQENAALLDRLRRLIIDPALPPPRSRRDLPWPCL